MGAGKKKKTTKKVGKQFGGDEKQRRNKKCVKTNTGSGFKGPSLFQLQSCFLPE